jgi:hypothetical protein
MHKDIKSRLNSRNARFCSVQICLKFSDQGVILLFPGFLFSCLLSHDIRIKIYDSMNCSLRFREERWLRVLNFRMLKKLAFVGLKYKN